MAHALDAHRDLGATAGIAFAAERHDARAALALQHVAIEDAFVRTEVADVEREARDRDREHVSLEQRTRQAPRVREVRADRIRAGFMQDEQTRAFLGQRARIVLVRTNRRRGPSEEQRVETRVGDLADLLDRDAQPRLLSIMRDDVPTVVRRIALDREIDSGDDRKTSMRARIAAPRGGFALAQRATDEFVEREVRGESHALEQEVQGARVSRFGAHRATEEGRYPAGMLRPALRAAALLLAAACTSTDRGPDDARDAGFDVEHYALDLEIDPAARTLHGACRVRLWPTKASLTAVELDLEGLAVESVHDADGAELRFTQDDDSVTVHFARRVELEEYAEFTVRYGGSPRRGLYFAGDRGHGSTQAWTQGECVDARAWFPCQDEPWERATSELTVRVPKSWRVVAAGERVERREVGEHAFEYWRVNFPHPAYLETLAAGEFAVHESTWDGIPLQFVAERRLEPHLDATFTETDEILAFFSRVTGVRYPYPKYAQVAVDGFIFGGMENVSATTLIDAAVTDAAGLADAPATGLIAHEAAHQWFGDLVTCADWSHAWLNEGFATYFASLYVEEARGGDEFLLAMADQRAGWLARDVGANRRAMIHLADGDPILSFLTGHAYEGGAVRLHHLRRLLGDEAFFRGIQLYLGENGGRSVVTDDLRRAFDAASGRDLRVHFERWFEGVGHPVVEVTTRHDAERGELSVEVVQTQEEPPFPCVVEVEIADESGVRVERFELEGRSERFVLRQSITPRWVRFDPACAFPALIRETRSFAEWLAILSDGPDAAGRRQAADVLGRRERSGSDTGLETTIEDALRRALASDPSLAVRRRIAELRSGANAGADRDALVERARLDTDPSVRAAALRALEPTKSSALDAELGALARAEIARGASYAAVGAALGLLARVEPNDALAMLEREIAVESPHGERAARVVTQIARLADPRVVDTLRAVARDESLPDAPRRIAIADLGRRSVDDAATRADVLALLDSPRSSVRREALTASGHARTADVRARLERHARDTTDSRERAESLRILAAWP